MCSVFHFTLNSCRLQTCQPVNLLLQDKIQDIAGFPSFLQDNKETSKGDMNKWSVHGDAACMFLLNTLLQLTWPEKPVEQ